MAHIELNGVTKRYGPVTAVDGLTLTLQPGRVTGFVGANGAGKSTTIRMLLGLTRPSEGTITIDGKAYADLPHPIQAVGGLVDPNVFHPNRRGRDSLRVIARAAGLPDGRVDEVLALVGLTRGRQPPGARLLHGHAATARVERRPAGRSLDPGPGRAGQRARPPRRALAARSDQRDGG